ncbi:putative membrane progestin receptor beta [Apostichopus japonicus]|uniref:Putative membrane progestin receptor beta n=1 Tax=Stichopus japonicus TaxID=307972 RepID=A0A2G8K7I5_STIJA|nr:putative membrane progestin receptor beta [Apostichopus japonicus]
MKCEMKLHPISSLVCTDKRPKSPRREGQSFSVSRLDHHPCEMGYISDAMGVRKVFPRVPSNTKLAVEVPLLFQEPDIYHGYRDNYQPFSYYTGSAFWLHNESVNVWTHLIALMVLLRQTWSLCSNLDLLNDGHAQVFAVYCFGCCAYTLASALAHLYQSRDELTHHTCFYMDYAGVSLYGNATALACYHLASPSSFFHFWRGWFMPLNCFLSVTMCACCGFAKYKYRRPYPKTRKYWQIISSGLGYAQIISPVYYTLIHQLYNRQTTPLGQDFYLHLLQCALFIPGSLFFAVPYPQRFWPGLCDLFGHSHQLFHVFMSLMTYFQMKALYLNVIQKRDIHTDLSNPSFLTTFGYVLVVLVLDLVVVWVLRMKTYQKLKKEAKD